MEHGEDPKERSNRQLEEVLQELRVVLPGAQVLLAFLLTVPFTNRFRSVASVDRAALFASLLLTVAGTVTLMGPSVYHRVRWQHGGKEEVVHVAHRMFLVGTALLAAGLGAGLGCVSDVLYGHAAGIVCTAAFVVLVLSAWYALPLVHGRARSIRQRE